MRTILLSAVLTGLFCSVFAFGIGFLANMLDQVHVLMVSFVSGFLGSIFASVVLGRGKRDAR